MMPNKGKKSKKKPLVVKILIAFAIILLVSAFISGYVLYKKVYVSNVNLGYKNSEYLYIPTGSDFNDVKKILYQRGMIKNKSSFEWLAEKKNYPASIKPGKYLVKADMTNNEIINLLRSGKQEPVKLTFNNIRTKEQLASRISKLIEADSVSIIKVLGKDSFLKKFNFTSKNIMALFIPDTYSIYWNNSAEQFIERMHKEYKKFWNEDRKAKAKNIGLSDIEVSVLASIVQQETIKTDEMSRVAGVYINRLERGMLLQADPTVIFAVGDFTIKRVLNKHLIVDSPYNTYKYAGLPPGPICLPSPGTIDKVLNYEKHDYIFFCAKEDFSGYHNFAKTGAQHSQNALKYQNALNKRKIKK
jgi:UPF0755 protein